MMKKQIFPKGTYIEDIMTFVKDGIEWDDNNSPSKTKELAIITIKKEGDKK